MYNIVVKYDKQMNLYVAFFENQPDANGTGNSYKEAVGDLMVENQLTFGVNIKSIPSK